MKLRLAILLFTVVLTCICFTQSALATSNHEYKSDEYATIVKGVAPNGRYSIAAHGEGEFGYDNFHIYLMNAQSGRKIGPLEEINNVLDTGANAYFAKWSKDSTEVSITYRQERHIAVMVRYRIAEGRATRISGPSKVAGLPPH